MRACREVGEGQYEMIGTPQKEAQETGPKEGRETAARALAVELAALPARILGSSTHLAQRLLSGDSERVAERALLTRAKRLAKFVLLELLERLHGKRMRVNTVYFVMREGRLGRRSKGLLSGGQVCGQASCPWDRARLSCSSSKAAPCRPPAAEASPRSWSRCTSCRRSWRATRGGC